MGRKQTKVHFLASEHIQYVKQYLKRTHQRPLDLQKHLPYPLHSQSLYAALRGDAITEETKEAVELMVTELRAQPHVPLAPTWSMR